MNTYIGHPHQVFGVEEMRLSGGKADGMRMLYVRNGKGLEFWVSVDRCADISRLSFKGDNYSYISPCGYVAPQYYDKDGLGFLKSFTAGFCTTCGLTGVGNPCTDDGEEVPLHGTISNIPCENIGHWVASDGIHIKAQIRDARIFSHKLLLEREYVVSLEKNEITMHDTVTNIGDMVSPLEVMYHCNMGYPLLDENTVLTIPSKKVMHRTEGREVEKSESAAITTPQNGIDEVCYYHTMSGETEVTMYSPTIKKGLKMSYNADEMKYFTQWKMLGEYDYVMGLEPGNCNPDGRDVMRKNGTLEFLKPGEKREFHLKFEAYEG